MSLSDTPREAQRQAFLRRMGWGEAARSDLAGDASSRRYERLVQPSGDRAVLMDAPPSAETPACPADATPDQRKALGYNALACLAGPDSGPFVALSAFLVEHGFSAPRVFGADLESGFLLLEDLGDDLFARIVNRTAREVEIYGCAVDLLIDLHAIKVPTRLPAGEAVEYALHHYDAYALGAETDLLTEWFIPAAIGTLSPQARADYRGLWHDVLSGLETREQVLVLRDYHAENLIWLPRREHRARVGLLDFQDGLRGNPAYDLVSLLQDARRDVSPELEALMLDRYCAAARRNADFDEAAFRRSYVILGIQRNAKIVGIFARLARRDGKPRYLGFLPRIWAYMERGLEQDEARKLKDWFDRNVPPRHRGVLDASAVA